MKTLLLITMLSCPKTKIINQTDLPWVEFDEQHLTTAKKRCGEIYAKSPCVKTFIKRTASDYSVICGKKE